MFGKTIENIRKKIDFKLVNNEEKAKRLFNRPNFDHSTYFDENFIDVNMNRTNTKFDQSV